MSISDDTTLLRDTPPEPGSFRALLSYRVHLLGSLLASVSDLRYRRKFQLRTIDVHIVAMVGTFGPLSVKTLCSELNLTKTYASRLVGELVERGFLAKKVDEQDGRSVSVSLTEEGAWHYKALYSDAVIRCEELAAGLSKKEAETFARCLEILVGSTRRQLAEEEKVEAKSPCDYEANVSDSAQGKVPQGEA